jgi:hypothetical protein
MALPTADQKQIKTNKAIVELVTVLELSPRIERLAKTISTVEAHASPGKAHRLSLKEIAAGAVYRACELIRCPRSVDLIAHTADCTIKTVLRAARLLAKGGGGEGLDAAGRPTNVKSEAPGAFAAVGDSLELLRCIGAINRVSTQSSLAIAAEQGSGSRSQMVVRLTAVALARQIWTSGALEGCMPQTVAAAAWLLTADRLLIDLGSVAKVADAFGITQGTVRKAVKATQAVVRREGCGGAMDDDVRTAVGGSGGGGAAAGSAAAPPPPSPTSHAPGVKSEPAS